MTAGLIVPSLYSEVSALAAAYAAEPRPSLEQEAMELLAGNHAALRAWADLDNAVDVLWRLENSVNPWEFLDEQDRALNLDAETAEIRARENWVSERAAARKTLLSAVSSW